MVDDKVLIYEMANYIANTEGGICILCKNNMKNITFDGINNGCDGACYNEKLTKDQKVKIINDWFVKGIENRDRKI